MKKYIIILLTFIILVGGYYLYAPKNIIRLGATIAFPPVGGTGTSTLTAYAVLTGGTTATGAFQTVSGLGSSAQVLTSNGAGTLPSWQAASGGAAFAWTPTLNFAQLANATTTQVWFQGSPYSLTASTTAILTYASSTQIQSTGNAYFSTASGAVTIGSAINLAKLAVDGQVDEIQLLVQGNGTQTTNLAVFENSAGTDVVSITGEGQTIFAPTGLSSGETGFLLDATRVGGGNNFNIFQIKENGNTLYTVDLAGVYTHTVNSGILIGNAGLRGQNVAIGENTANEIYFRDTGTGNQILTNNSDLTIRWYSVTTAGGLKLIHKKAAATGNEVLWDFDGTIDKLTSGNYTGIKLNVTETSAPGTEDRLLDLQVGAISKFVIMNDGTLAIGTSTPSSTIHATAGTSATTTLELGDQYSANSKACYNVKNNTGGSISFYFVGTTMVTENNRCR